MQRREGQPLYSATDLVNFLECEALTALDLAALDDRTLAKRKVAADESSALIARKGDEHERAHLHALRAAGRQVQEIAQSCSLDERVAATHAAMRAGAEVIYQATLRDHSWLGHADFLHRVEEPSLLGAWRYEVADTKLARSPKAKFIVQLAFYSDLVAQVQGVVPQRMHVVLGDQSGRAWRSADYMHYFTALRHRFVAAVDGLRAGTTRPAYPVPVEHCSLCDWRQHCEERRAADDHLSQVAGISRVQTARLEAAGVPTMAALATLPTHTVVPQLRAETLAKLRAQAALQREARQTGQRRVELVPLDPEGRRGFLRLPMPDAGDLFFDMEGDPLQVDGLEYLFGVGYMEQGAWTFRPFWAHDRQEERLAFEAFVDFVVDRLRHYPGAHVYHYASYEVSALQRLASMHATREVEVDEFLRHGVMVDLYKVVREGMRTSEPGYSIKNIERFYRTAREGDVKDAGASIVYYERWRETGEQQYLDDIEAYNQDDVESTQQLRDWLLMQRPTGLPWRAADIAPPRLHSENGDVDGNAPRASRVQQIEARLAAYRTAMVDPLPADRLQWSPRQHVLELAFQLLDFHRRAAKPEWWALFARMDQEEDALLDDLECLAGLTLDPSQPPVNVKRSMRYTYRVPEQETKLKSGDDVTRCDIGQSVGALDYDDTGRVVRLTIGPSKEPLPPRLSIGPKPPLDAKTLTEALYRFADSLIADDGRYPALVRFLMREPPRLAGRVSGHAIVVPTQDQIQGCIEGVRALDRSYLYVQGPPGAGKTYTGSRLIVALLADGKRIGVMSNSHKAINHLMACAIEEAQRQGVDVRPVKKASRGNEETELHVKGVLVENAQSNGDALALDGNLVGGTAWLFCDAAAEDAFDVLVVDEAGQVALANLIAAGTCARNVVLLGDQMQLGQPIQGVHPGHSGDSTLDYLLDGAATIPPDRGIFLATTWRMHPKVCEFISQAVYDGRLEPEATNVLRTVVLQSRSHPLLRSAGIVHAAIEHEGCSQSSEAEASLVADLYTSAIAQRYTDRDGLEYAMGSANILVVAPYNAQVNLLRRVLPADARIGTVDKFQGQEAEVVIVSMTTSSEHDLPRNIEFLYSKNRLNVAVSRAKCLAIVVANPALMAVRCSTPEQMALVNTLCWVSEAGRPET